MSFKLIDHESEKCPANIKIGVRPETRKKVERIARANRWSLVETIDAMADAFVQPSVGTGTQPITANDARASGMTAALA